MMRSGLYLIKHERPFHIAETRNQIRKERNFELHIEIDTIGPVAVTFQLQKPFHIFYFRNVRFTEKFIVQPVVHDIALLIAIDHLRNQRMQLTMQLRRDVMNISREFKHVTDMLARIDGSTGLGEGGDDGGQMNGAGLHGAGS